MLIFTVPLPRRTGTALDPLARLGYFYMQIAAALLDAIYILANVPLLVFAMGGIGAELSHREPNTGPILITDIHEVTPKEAETEDQRTDAQKGIYRFNEGETGDDEDDGEPHKDSKSDQTHHERQNLTWKQILDKILDLEARLDKIQPREGALNDSERFGI